MHDVRRNSLDANYPEWRWYCLEGGAHKPGREHDARTQIAPHLVLQLARNIQHNILISLDVYECERVCRRSQYLRSDVTSLGNKHTRPPTAHTDGEAAAGRTLALYHRFADTTPT